MAQPAPAVLHTLPPLRTMRRLRGMSPLRHRLVTTRGLWLADEFLLQMVTTFATRELQRFSYRDIQALQICRTARGWIYSMIWGIPAFLCACASFLVPREPERVGWWIATGVFLLFLLVNVARGGTCRTVLHTALGSQPLYTLSRTRQARRAVALLAERVMAAQSAGQPVPPPPPAPAQAATPLVEESA